MVRRDHILIWMFVKELKCSEIMTGNRSGTSKASPGFAPFKTIPDPMIDGPSVSHSADFKANRGVAPSTVVADLQSNVTDYISQVEFEMKIAIGLKKSIDDISSVVEYGSEMNKEIPGTSIVDMQVCPCPDQLN